MKAGSLLQVQLECRTRLRVFCYRKMLPREQYAEAVSQEAEGLSALNSHPHLQRLHSSHVKVSSLSLISETGFTNSTVTCYWSIKNVY